MSLNRLVRIAVPVLILVSMVYFFRQTNAPTGAGGRREIPYSQFVQAIDENNVQDGTLGGQYFQGHFTRGNGTFTVALPPQNTQEYTSLIQRLQAHGVRYRFQTRPLSGNLTGTVASIVLPLVIIFFFWAFFLRQARRNQL